MSGALHTLRIQFSYSQTQCEVGARDVRVLKLTHVMTFLNDFQFFRMPKKKINSKTKFPVFKKNSNWLTLVLNSLKDLLINSKPPLTVFLNLS